MTKVIVRPIITVGEGMSSEVVPTPCLRLKTDQFGPPEDLIDFTAEFEASGQAVVISQPSTGAQGTWVRFAYLVQTFDQPDCRQDFLDFESGPPPLPPEPGACVEWQQFLVLKDASGAFAGGEISGSGLSFQIGAGPVTPMGINPADSTEPDFIFDVDCDSGSCPPAICPVSEFSDVSTFTPVIVTPGQPVAFMGPFQEDYLEYLASGGGSRFFAKVDDVFVASATIWPKERPPWGFIMCEIEPSKSTGPPGVGNIQGSVVAKRMPNTPGTSATAISTFENNVDFPGREWVVFDILTTPSRLLPGQEIFNAGAGKTVFLRNPLRMLRWTSAEDSDPADFITK